MIRKIILLTALFAIPAIAVTTKAQAGEYCREYTKTVSIGGRAEQAYGTACYKPDGSWEIVSLEGSNTGRAQVKEVIYDDLRHSRRNVVVVERVNYTPRYYARPAAYRWPVVFNFGFGDHHDKRRYDYKKHNSKHDNRHDNRHDNGRRGHR